MSTLDNNLQLKSPKTSNFRDNMRAKCIWNTEDKRPTFFCFLKTHSVTDRITENFDFF